MKQPTLTAELVRQASQQLLSTVDSLDPEAWARPSLLPGWNVADVVAHLALNAEGFNGALQGAIDGVPVPMYRSDDARDLDIAELSVMGPDTIAHRLHRAVERLDTLLADVGDEVSGTRIERTPGSGRWFTVDDVAGLRRREVEIHHCDLGPGAAPHTPAEWSTDFTISLIELAATREFPRGFVASASDLGRTWTFGTPGPTVTATSYTLAWWLTGRSPYPGTRGPVSDDGTLPRIEGP